MARANSDGSAGATAAAAANPPPLTACAQTTCAAQMLLGMRRKRLAPSTTRCLCAEPLPGCVAPRRLLGACMTCA